MRPFPPPGAVLTFERRPPAVGVGWEHNRGLGSSFGYNHVENESLTLGPRALAEHCTDVVSRGGRLLLNVGPDASGRIPDVQRRTLDGVTGWMSALKAYTADRRYPGADAVMVAAEDGNWCRHWASEDRLVVVADRSEAVHATAPGREVVRIALPD